VRDGLRLYLRAAGLHQPVRAVPVRGTVRGAGAGDRRRAAADAGAAAVAGLHDRQPVGAAEGPVGPAQFVEPLRAAGPVGATCCCCAPSMRWPWLGVLQLADFASDGAFEKAME
jgi:bacterioferritin-associated ferredoxin